MWLLIDEQTNRVLDIQEQPFPVAEGLLWVEDTSITNRSKAANFTYDRQKKEFTELPKPPEPRDLVSEKLKALEIKLEQLETKGEREPVLGMNEVPQDSFGPLSFVTPFIVGAYLIGKKFL